jgi:hypothetical protein
MQFSIIYNVISQAISSPGGSAARDANELLVPPMRVLSAACFTGVQIGHRQTKVSEPNDSSIHRTQSPLNFFVNLILISHCRLSIYLSIYLSTYLSLYSPFVEPWPLFQFLNRWVSLSVGSARRKPLLTHRTTQSQNKCTRTSMPPVGCELTIPAFERAKTVHVSDRAATVIGGHCRLQTQFLHCRKIYRISSLHKN